MSPRKLPPRQELVNVLEFEDVAQLVLDRSAYAAVAGGDRSGFDRMTFRPHLMTPTLDLDLTVTLFGEPHFAPILVAPIAEQRRFHRDAEVATARGAAAAHAGLLVSNKSSAAISDIAAEANTPLWFAAYLDGAANDVRAQIDRAIAAGCKVVCACPPAGGASGARGVTEGVGGARGFSRAIETLAKTLTVPLVVKGVMTADDAKTAVSSGAQGVVVSDHGAAGAKTTTIEMLPSIAEAIADRATVLVDGSFRRGSDIAKALILGAQAVLIGRPVMWGLAAYGADGVQSVLELLQTDLGRTMAALGAANVRSLTRDMLRIHTR